MAAEQQADAAAAPNSSNPTEGADKDGQDNAVEIDNADTLADARAAFNSGEADIVIEHLETLLSERGGNSSSRTEIPISFKDPRKFTWLIVAFASMGGLLSGLDQSLISGANLFMPEDLHLNSNEASLINSGMPLGAILGAMILSPSNEIFGRRMSIMIACVLYTIGAALEASAQSFGMMLAGRIVLGAGVGLEGGTVPVYVAESVPRKLRGNLVSFYQLNIALGEVFGYIVAAIFVDVEGSWRYILGSSLLFSTILFVGMIFLPESPRYLMHNGKTVEAFGVWKRIRGLNTMEDKEEFFAMKNSVEEERADTHRNFGRFAWLDLLTVPRARRALVYANIMVFLGQFTGVNAIMYYMSVLMSQIGFSDKNAVFMSLVGGGALLIGTIPAIFWMEKFGRRFWANAMLPGFFIGLILVGCSYLFDINTQLVAAQGMYLTGLIIYMAFFGSYACLTWVLPSEVYPTYLRSYGMTTSDATLFLCSFIVTYNFTRMQEAMTKMGLTLGFYGGIAVIGWIYQILFMPETKGKTLEEIDVLFEQPTHELVKQNLKNTLTGCNDMLHGRWGKVYREVTMEA
ncbi:hypothetical protein OIDMADRAFT_106856 [Oidiodendron maius Zn]|uniref:Major facilitator superfamily (MFS) profile domain-containing protein n=1 Tax=Oidiodendron maius (strain Zn) TaxID=913774 RepID=A0A0C3CW64_OIDMZ|nr:hypothetical protein OIDMADRAFT_106856 [Oidiodendron maius Zn]